MMTTNQTKRSSISTANHDLPQCASPVLTSYYIRLNNLWNDNERQLLLGLIPKLVGTRGDRRRHEKQAYVLVDASVREIVPLVLDMLECGDLATRLREIAPITDVATARVAREVCNAVRAEAWKRSKTVTAEAVATTAEAAVAVAEAAAAVASYADADAAVAVAEAAEAVAVATYDTGGRRSIILATLAALERAISYRIA